MGQIRQTNKALINRYETLLTASEIGRASCRERV